MQALQGEEFSAYGVSKEDGGVALVEVPKEQISSKVVRGDRNIDVDWLRVDFSVAEPADAWVKVNHRGLWFYIPGNDLASRTSLGLLDAIFQAGVGNVPGAKPLLTLPVR